MQQFGGDWTETKLLRVNRYLRAYLQALKRYSFTKVYIDAFAGTGHITQKKMAFADIFSACFEELNTPEVAQIMEGSALEAIKLDPPFDVYIFIEKSKEKCAELQSAIDQFPSKKSQTIIRPDDANVAIKNLCSQWQRNWRGVLFLDPFGLQVDWDTIEAVAATQSIDLWYLFPTGMGINRMLPKDRCFPEGFQKRLDTALGTHDWFNRFYARNKKIGLLFDDDEEQYRKIADQEAIEKFVVERLKTIFCGVAENPLTLYNSKHSPMFSLCFACNNSKGSEIALRIAEHILKA